MEFKQIFKKEKSPKCPECLGGRLIYDRRLRIWKCSSGWMWCGRKFKGKMEDSPKA